MDIALRLLWFKFRGVDHNTINIAWFRCMAELIVVGAVGISVTLWALGVPAPWK
jgi:hypothetical protein